MKLRQISEDFMGQKLREMLGSTNYFNKMGINSTPLYDPTTGHDSGARTTGYNYLTTGVPHKPRNRKFLGLQSRPGTIRL